MGSWWWRQRAAVAFIVFFTIFFIFYSYPVSSQQTYVGTGTYNCNLPQPNSTSSTIFGYSCNGVRSTCSAYLVFRSSPPYTTVSSIASLLSADPSDLSQANNVLQSATFPENTQVVVPITCSCSSPFYQANTSYITKTNDTYSGLASFPYQGLSTCQSILRDNNYPSTTDLLFRTNLTVPLRCACPTKNQTESGVNYLLTYVVVSGESVWLIATRFGVDLNVALDANGMTMDNSEIYTFTTLLLPLQQPPNASQIQTTVPTSSPPPPLTSPPPRSRRGRRRKKNKMTAAIVGAVVGSSLLLAAVGGCYRFVFQRRAKPSSPMNVEEKPFVGADTAAAIEFLKASTSVTVTDSFKVYTLKELQTATKNFSPSCRIGGSVYRGRINGDWAAIKKIGVEPLTEMKLLRSVNHFNIIRLSGFCFGEGEWYLVYEYAMNGALREWLHGRGETERGILSWSQRLSIAVDMAEGLGYMHKHVQPPYMHTNLTSGCVLLDEDLRAKVAGLSRAKAMGEERVGVTRHIVGEKAYLAPEYVEQGLVSACMDVYALGVVLLEMVTGKEAVELQWGEAFGWWEMAGDEERKRRLEMVKDEGMPKCKGWEEMAVYVVGLAGKCLNKEPSQRPAMEDISLALSAVLTSVTSG